MTTNLFAPASTARVDDVEVMRERFNALMTVVGTIYDQRHTGLAMRQPDDDDPRRAERNVLRSLTRLEATAEQAAREWERGDQAAAEDTLNLFFAAVQGDLLTHLRALADSETDRLAANRIRDWADDLAALAESEA